MKRYPLSLLPLLFIGCGLFPQNPNVSPKVRNFVAVQDGYSLTVSGLSAVRAAGGIGDADARKVETARLAAATALDFYRGNVNGEQDWRRAYADLLNVIAQIGVKGDVDREKAKRSRPRTATADDEAALAASDGFRKDAEARWLAMLR